MTPTFIAGLHEYKTMAEQITAQPWETLDIEELVFPDGESYHRIITNPRNAHVVLICGTPTDRHLVDLIDCASACAKMGAKTLTLVIPYFGYSTMERATKPGEVVKAKVRARMLSSIPQAKEGNQILFLDLHAEGIPHYLEGNTTGYHIYAEEKVLCAVQHLVGNDPFCMASTDGGRSKWVQSLAKKLGVSCLSALKTRESGTKTTLQSIQGNCQGLNVVIYDDMIRTGGSLLEAAKGYAQAGADKIFVVATHGVFPADSLRKILDTRHGHRQLIDKIICFDTLPHVYQLKKTLGPAYQGLFEIRPIAGVIQTALQNHL